ncbi:hypothetical protein PanWU01x14_116220 [Parasponia andersonii]|uniref:DUF1985 domain-containing protein n=1 Tax=Parasponia andersonii TaxID=3476 RepID=A0A2P5CX36_PARAD|nr:hypothetical protein PanWU01x14_116220 [Parasponia andersonii]
MREIHFDIGSKHIRFGLCEFSLTTGLNFRKCPDEAKLKTMSRSRRLVEKYMNDSKVVRISELEVTFLNYGNTKDASKVGICYLVDSLLPVGESTKKIDLDILSYVKNENKSFHKTIVGLKKDSDHCRKQYLKLVKEKKKHTECKYTVYMFNVAL